MLPPGHASAGYLVADLIISLLHIPPSDPAAPALVWAGFVFGAIPDLDMFAAFFKTRSMVIENDKQSHRLYITHTPVFWICAALVVFVLTRDVPLTLIVACAPLSHLVLDSIEDEIRWLWPLSRKAYRLIIREDLSLPRESFFSYWKKFVTWYVQKRTITAVCEAVIVGMFLFTFLRR